MGIYFAYYQDILIVMMVYIVFDDNKKICDQSLRRYISI